MLRLSKRTKWTGFAGLAASLFLILAACDGGQATPAPLPTATLSPTSAPTPGSQSSAQWPTINISSFLGVNAAPQPSSTAHGHTLSDQGVSFIARHEGLKEKPYDDSVGNCTVGVGHLLHMGRCNGTEAALSTSEALDLFKKDAASRVEVVNRLVTVDLTQTQFDALVSFVFNVGEGNFTKSDLLEKLNAKDYAAVPAEFDRWHIPPEIIGRRNDERDLFASGRY